MRFGRAARDPFNETPGMHGTYDEDADAAYIYLTDAIGVGESKRQAIAEADGLTAMVVLDFDDQERLLGIEIIGARGILRPETIESLNRH